MTMCYHPHRYPHKYFLHMKSYSKNFISMIILLLSWAFFVSPAVSSVIFQFDEQHQMHSSAPLCDSKSCSMHSTSLQSCAEHCESLSFIASLLINNQDSTDVSFPVAFMDSSIFYQYQLVELKPPIQL